MKVKNMLRWMAVVLWMVVIFLFSEQTGDRSGNTSGELVRWVIDLLYRNFAEIPESEQTRILEMMHLMIRKGAHFSEYAVLAILAANALRSYSLSKLCRWLIPIGFCALYAVSDEIHQYFVPDRACRFLDVCIDTAGGAFGTAVFTFLGFVSKSRRRKQ